MHKARLALFAVVGLAVATTAILVIDDYSVRKHVKRTMSTKRSTVTEEDRAWWERHVGPVPGGRAPEVNVVLPGITGGPALGGNRFHRDGEDGEDGGSADGREWGDIGPFEAVELRNPAGQLRGRLLLSSDTAAYRLVELGSLAFFERDAIVSPPDVVDNPLDSDQWTRRPRWGPLLGVEAIGVLGGILVGWFVTARERSRLRAIVARRERAASSSARDDFDDRCPVCGHDLRAIEELRCSECGGEVGPPGGRARLELADPGWRRRVWLGRSIVSGAARVIVAAILLQMPLLAIGFHLPRLESHYVEETLAILEGISWWGGIVAAIGAFLFTAADPRERHQRRAWSLRRAARVAAVLVLAYPLLPFLPRVPVPLAWVAWVVWFAVMSVQTFALAVIALGTLHRAGTLAARVGAFELAERCARRWRLHLACAGVAAALILGINVFFILIARGVVSVPQTDNTQLILSIVPLLPSLILYSILLGPLAALGCEWRVAIATARRELPSGTSASEAPVDSGASSDRPRREDPMR